MFRAVLDTCALVPGRQRDFLLQLAAEHSYVPLWGSGIVFELDYVLARIDEARGRDGSKERRIHLFAQMKRAFPGATIDAPKDRDYGYGLADPDDGHVAHAAIIGKAGVRAVHAMSRRMVNPTMSEQAILAELRGRYGMGEAAELLGPELATSPDHGR